MKTSRGQLSISDQTIGCMAEVFDANEPSESAILLRMAAARERRRLQRGEARVRRKYAWAGAFASLCLCGSAFGLAVQSGQIQWISQTDGPAPAVEMVKPADSPAPRRSGTDKPSVVPVTSPEKRDGGSARSLSYPEVDQSRPLGPARKRTGAGGWKEVADAMREGKDSEAKEAIRPLTTSEDWETRDSAELVKLRIELGSHRAGKLDATSSQRVRLGRLAQEGASPTIRASARRLLDRLTPVGVAGFEETQQ